MMFHGEDQEPMLGGSTATRTTQPKPQNDTPNSTDGGVHTSQPKSRFVLVRRDRIFGTILEVDSNIDQPDPDKIWLYHACLYRIGCCVSYYYYEDIPRWYRIIRILAVVFAILTSPLALICFLPMLYLMRKVYNIIVNPFVHWLSSRVWL